MPDSKTAVESSGSGWSPVFVSLGDANIPSTSGIDRTSERIVRNHILSSNGIFFNIFHKITLINNSLVDNQHKKEKTAHVIISVGYGSDKIDLKGEITKFLEELIDKHPETLDAIENVRMNRLGRMPASTINLSASSSRPSVLMHQRFY